MPFREAPHAKVKGTQQGTADQIHEAAADCNRRRDQQESRVQPQLKFEQTGTYERHVISSHESQTEVIEPRGPNIESIVLGWGTSQS